MKLMRCNRYVDLFEHRLQSKHVIMTVMLSSICRYKNDIVDAGMSKSGGGGIYPLPGNVETWFLCCKCCLKPQ